MKFNPSIQKSICWVLLLIFTISVTPKKYFHDVFTHEHTDELFIVNHTKEKQFTTYQYNCGFVNVVATSPFVVASSNIDFDKVQYKSCFVETLSNSYQSQTPLHFSLRGPPVA